MSEAGLSCINTFEKGEINVLLAFDLLFFSNYTWLDVFEIASVQELEEVVPMKIGNISIVPQYL